MKRFLILAAGLVLGLGIQSAYAVRGAHASRKMYSNAPVRTNFILPSIDGLNCYTADLHVHTIFSDGELAPEERVKEAWIDGLDIMAITDHIETRRHERTWLKFLKGYSPDKKGFEQINTRCSRGVHADERGIVSDLNLSVELARKAAANYPELTIIKGTEISREPEHFGHYCALFTKDNNIIYSRDDAQAIRNARAQGALITHNHPGWERLSTNYTEFEKKIYAEGLIDGIEVTNGKDFYPEIVRRAIDKKLYMVSATDIHATTASIFGKQNFYRDMTLIFAKDKSEQSLRKALLSQKTLGYCGGYIIGEESLLKKFFLASVTVKAAGDSSKGEKICISNNSSFDYTLKHNGRVWQLPAFQTISIPLFGKEPLFSVENMIHVDEKHPVVELKVSK
jgi:predicted metal-dependent phosphoesterase TrpH